MSRFDVQSKTQIDLLRHGECEGGHVFRGSTDIDLSPEGVCNMRRVCERVNEEWDIIVTSPLKRCHIFAGELAAQRDIPIQFEDDLREMCFGDWEGREIENVWRDEEMQMRAWSQNPLANTPPSGEPLVDVCTRVDAVQTKIMQQFASKKILIVSHGGIIRVILAKLLDIPLSGLSRLDVPYACISRLAVYNMESGSIGKMLAHNF